MKSFLALLALFVCLSANAQALLSDDIPHPFYAVHSQSENKVMPIHNGYAALQLRLEMIRRAKKNVEAEYFIYNVDLAGKIFTRELVAAAKRGVKVRILIDRSMPIFVFNEYFVDELVKQGIEVKYYNTAPLYKISTIQFRNHRKLLTVDDEEAITGGRNIGDDYFDLSLEFNFNDRDIYVKGPLAKVMRESFDAYFDHKISKKPKSPRKPGKMAKSSWRLSHAEKLASAQTFLIETDEETHIREQLSKVGGKILANSTLYVCPVATFSSDGPGATFFSRLSHMYDERYRFLRKTLFDKLAAVDKSVILSSPYMINNRKSRAVMNGILEKGVEITLYTNSLASTDAVYVAANLYKDMFTWRRRGMKVFLHDGTWPVEDIDLPEGAKKAVWGTHDKTQVYETHKYTEVMIGTYNIDNRSNFYNSEMAVFCRGNDEFTKNVKDDIFQRAHQGIEINEDGSATDRAGERHSVYGSSKRGLLLMKMLALPSWLLKFLL